MENHTTKFNNELKATQNELKTTQNDLKETQNELKATKVKLEQTMVDLSTLEQKLTSYESIEVVFKSLETKQPLPKPTNQIEQTKNSHEEKHEMLLKKMKNGEIRHIDDKQLIFKLNHSKNHLSLSIHHFDNISSFATKYAKYVVVKNNQLVVLDMPVNDSGYRIYLQIPNYNDKNSHCYLYPKNENENKLLLKNGGWINDIIMENYKTPSNEILFHVIKK